MFILTCTIEGQEYAFDLAKVESSILATEVTSLPRAPEFVLGAINIHGQVIPVFNMRKLLNLPTRELEIKDQFILCYVHQKHIALWVDNVKQVKFCDEKDLIPADHSCGDAEAVQYVVKDNGQIILLYDLEKLLSSHTLQTATV